MMLLYVNRSSLCICPFLLPPLLVSVPQVSKRSDDSVWEYSAVGTIALKNKKGQLMAMLPALEPVGSSFIGSSCIGVKKYMSDCVE